VPNVDSISSFADDTHGTVVFLEPKGICVIPMNSQQVLEAMCCILGALVVSLFKSMDCNTIIISLKVMHEEPKPIFHRDIRWANIIRHADDPTRWLLIDWEDAATPPTIAAMHLHKSSHAPTVFLDNHGPEVDVWAVGMLIIERSRDLLRLPSYFRVLGETLQSGTLSALEALERVKVLKESL
jgi:serine/threonine protein kinase